jgi:hypothetical protein
MDADRVVALLQSACVAQRLVDDDCHVSDVVGRGGVTRPGISRSHCVGRGLVCSEARVVSILSIRPSEQSWLAAELNKNFVVDVAGAQLNDGVCARLRACVRACAPSCVRACVRVIALCGSCSVALEFGCNRVLFACCQRSISGTTARFFYPGACRPTPASSACRYEVRVCVDAAVTLFP